MMLFRWWAVVSLLLVFSVESFGQSDPPALLITPAGHYFVVLDGQGKPTLVEIKQIIRIGDVPPVDPPVDPPPTGSEVTTKVKVWAEEVDQPAAAQALALIYRTIADKVDDGTLKPENAFPAIKQATDQILPTVGDSSKWTGWRTKLGDLITAKLQSGELTHPQHLVKFLREVGTGLDQSAKAAAALNPEVVQKIIELIVYLLTLFTSAEGPGPV